MSVSPWEGKICLGRRERRKGNGSQGREDLKTPGFDGDVIDIELMMVNSEYKYCDINDRLVVGREAEGLSLRL